MAAHDVVNRSGEQVERVGRILDIEGFERRAFPLGVRWQAAGARRSHSVVAEIEVPRAGAEGLIVSQGGSMGAWSLYVHGGKLGFHYSYVGLLNSEVTATSTLLPGRHEAGMEFTYDGGGIGRGGRVSLYVDGRKVGEGRLQRTHRLFFSTDESLTLGCDVAPPPPESRTPRNTPFAGKINWVQIEAGGSLDRTQVPVEGIPTSLRQ
jgi:hypothetical protein